ncbi:MAG: helix-turn-helix domain-containing protein [Actinobacteria bacterium]|nr:helix-turn-helix domain-containing protein [Actinomycetota bacterium]
MGRKRRVGFADGDAAENAPTPLFVRIPKTEADKLDRAAFQLKRSKQAIVASLIARYVDPATWPASHEAETEEITVGRHTFRSSPLDVLTPVALADLLQIDEELVVSLAERGEIPGRKIGGELRFSRQAVLDWLGATD